MHHFQCLLIDLSVHKQKGRAHVVPELDLDSASTLRRSAGTAVNSEDVEDPLIHLHSELDGKGE